MSIKIDNYNYHHNRTEENVWIHDEVSPSLSPAMMMISKSLASPISIICALIMFFLIMTRLLLLLLLLLLVVVVMMMMMMHFISASATATTTTITTVDVDHRAIISIAILPVSSELTTAVTPLPIDGGSTTTATILLLLLLLLFLLIWCY